MLKIFSFLVVGLGSVIFLKWRREEARRHPVVYKAPNHRMIRLKMRPTSPEELESIKDLIRSLPKSGGANVPAATVTASEILPDGNRIHVTVE